MAIKTELSFEMKQLATPATVPASGYDKLYFKSDDALYRLKHNGTETTVGSPQTPWASNIDGGGFGVANVGHLYIGASVDDGFGMALQVNNGLDINQTTGRFLVQSAFHLSDGIAFATVNSGNTANTGLEFRSSNIYFNSVTSGIINFGVETSTPVVSIDTSTNLIHINGAADDGNGLELNVFGGGHFYGGMTYFGSGWFINLSGNGSYMLATAPAGYNAGFTAHRDGLTQGQYCSVDLLENSTPTSGWSFQMQPSDSNLAILDRVNGTNLLYFHSGGGTDVYNKFTKYENIATTGKGVPAIYGYARVTGQTAANTSIVTYTLGASDGSFLISANVLVTTATLHNFTATATYTDEGNTSRTVTLQFSTLAGAFVTAMTNAQGAVPYEGVALHIRAKASTAITIKTAGTFTTVVYNIEGTITQVA